MNVTLLVDYRGIEKEALMNAFEVVLLVTALFVLRFALPLALTVAICCGLNRIQARWSGAV